MAWLREWVGSYLGLPPAEPGQLQAWKLVFHAPWPVRAGPVTAGVAMALLAGLVVWAYRHGAKRVTPGRLSVLIGLRLLLLALAVLLAKLLRVTLLRGEPTPFIMELPPYRVPTIRSVLIELRDDTLFYNLQGQPVRLEGLGTYTPKVSLDDTFGIGHRADMKIKNGLNAPDAFSARLSTAI